MGDRTHTALRLGLPLLVAAALGLCGCGKGGSSTSSSAASTPPAAAGTSTSTGSSAATAPSTTTGTSPTAKKSSGATAAGGAPASRPQTAHLTGAVAALCRATLRQLSTTAARVQPNPQTLRAELARGVGRSVAVLDAAVARAQRLPASPQRDSALSVLRANRARLLNLRQKGGGRSGAGPNGAIAQFLRSMGGCADLSGGR